MTIEGEGFLGSAQFKVNGEMTRKLICPTGESVEATFNGQRLKVEDWGENPLKDMVGGSVLVHMDKDGISRLSLKGDVEEVTIANTKAKTSTTAEIRQEGRMMFQLVTPNGTTHLRFNHTK